MVDFLSKRSQPVRELSCVYGVFDGEGMVADGTTYPVSGNYASKSKLIDGDALKMVIKSDGTMFFKQMRHVDRESVFGTYLGDNTVRVSDKTFKVIQQSVSFYGLAEGDMVACEVSKDRRSTFAAVTGIVRRPGGF